MNGQSKSLSVTFKGQEPEEFDSPRGWGLVLHSKGLDTAEKAILGYLTDNPDLDRKWRATFAFRLAQISALKKEPQAWQKMTHAFTGDREWDSYVGATISFLRGDGTTLKGYLGDLIAMGLSDKNSLIVKIKRLQWILNQGSTDYTWFIQPVRIAPRVS